MQPLRSISITETSSLLRVAPPLCLASVLSFLWDLHLNFSLNIETIRLRRIPHKSLTQFHAIFTPEAAQAVSRFSLNLSWTHNRNPVLTSSIIFRRLIEWFAFARLSESYLPRSFVVTFPKTLTTLALYQRSFRWFEACSCKPAPSPPRRIIFCAVTHTLYKSALVAHYYENM